MDLIHYLLISTVCLGVSYLAFRIIFEKEVNFRQQRIFLMTSVAFSLILPATNIRVEIADLFGNKPAPVSYFQLPVSKIQQPVFSAGESLSGNTDLFMSIYTIVMILCIAVMVMQFIKILWLYSVSDKTQHTAGIILRNKSIVSPFSFFRWIFIPENIYDREERESIIVHESIHVSQYHSFDNLLFELTAAVMWFNPLVWMMKKSLHLVHEYLADEGTLRAGIDKTMYQALLVNQIAEERLISLSSSFNNSLIKKRMIMMTKSMSYRQNKLKILTLLPLSAILFLTVAMLNGLFPREIKAGGTETKSVGPSDPIATSGIVIQDTTKNKPQKADVKWKVVNEKGEKIDSVKQVIVKKIETKNKENVIVKEKGEKVEVKYKDNIKEKVDVVEKVDVIKDVDIIDEVDVIEDVDVMEDIDVIEDVDVQAVVDVRAEVNVQSEPDVQEKIDPTVMKVKVVIDPGTSDSLTYFIDGVNVKNIKGLDPEEIESMSVWKDENRVEITTKAKAGKQGKPTIAKVPGNLLYIVDGVTVDKNEFEKLEPDQIESMSILKGKDETEGIIKVTTRAR